jgi:hypothetical protein
MIQINEYNLKVGDEINVFYSNGEYCGEIKVTRITENSCFFSHSHNSNREYRESWNTINTLIKNGSYKLNHN